MNSPICRSDSIGSSCSLLLLVTALINSSTRSLSITASVCSNSFSVAGRRDLEFCQRLDELRGTVAHQSAFVQQYLDHLLHEERISLGALDDQPLERGEISTLSRARLIAALALSRN